MIAMEASGESAKIYLTLAPGGTDKKQVRLAVFLKGSRGLQKNLIGFLRNQNINCEPIPAGLRKSMQEFVYFEEGFFILLNPQRWSFYELRGFIQTYADMCEEDIVLRDDLTAREEKENAAEEILLDDRVFLYTTREIDKCFDRYYEQNMSISLFLSGILKMLRQQLQLYWVAVQLQDTTMQPIGYLNYEPTTLPRTEIAKTCSRATKAVLRGPVDFHGEHIADFFLKAGPFSPRPAHLEDFLKHVIMHVDGFLYGHLLHKRETIRLKSEIAELRKTNQEKADHTIEREQRTLKKLRLVVIGDSLLNNSQILAEFTSFGLDVHNIELHTDHDKYRTLDTNNLLAIRSRFDGILLGPMPHRMKGDFEKADNLIVQMERNTAQYPPFVVVRDKRGDLKITKSSLRKAIENLMVIIKSVGRYSQEQKGE